MVPTVISPRAAKSTHMISVMPLWIMHMVSLPAQYTARSLLTLKDFFL